MTQISTQIEVREREADTCAICGMTNNLHLARFGRSLHVHRTTPGDEYQAKACELLCMHCHHKRHGNKTPYKIHQKYRNVRREGRGILTVDMIPNEALRALESICREFNLSTYMAIDTAIALLETEAEKIRENL